MIKSFPQLLDEATEINTEKIVRKKESENRIDSAILEQKLRRFTKNENQTSNILFNIANRRSEKNNERK